MIFFRELTKAATTKSIRSLQGYIPGKRTHNPSATSHININLQNAEADAYRVPPQKRNLQHKQLLRTVFDRYILFHHTIRFHDPFSIIFINNTRQNTTADAHAAPPQKVQNAISESAPPRSRGDFLCVRHATITVRIYYHHINANRTIDDWVPEFRLCRQAEAKKGRRRRRGGRTEDESEIALRAGCDWCWVPVSGRFRRC